MVNGSFLFFCQRVVILPTVMEQEANLFMEQNSLMRTSHWNTLRQVINNRCSHFIFKPGYMIFHRRAGHCVPHESQACILSTSMPWWTMLLVNTAVTKRQRHAEYGNSSEFKASMRPHVKSDWTEPYDCLNLIGCLTTWTETCRELVSSGCEVE